MRILRTIGATCQAKATASIKSRFGEMNHCFPLMIDAGIQPITLCHRARWLDSIADDDELDFRDLQRAVNLLDAVKTLLLSIVESLTFAIADFTIVPHRCHLIDRHAVSPTWLLQLSCCSDDSVSDRRPGIVAAL